MSRVELFERIRREHRDQGLSIRELAERHRVHRRTVVERDAVELLRCVGEGVGLLRVRGDRLEATSLRNAWAQIDQGLRAGLAYAAWCQQVTLTGWPTWHDSIVMDAAEPYGWERLIVVK